MRQIDCGVYEIRVYVLILVANLPAKKGNQHGK